jgi:hypothetical protein
MCWLSAPLGGGRSRCWCPARNRTTAIRIGPATLKWGLSPSHRLRTIDAEMNATAWPPTVGPLDALSISSCDQRLLERWVRGRTTPRHLLLRAQIVLLAGKGVSDRRIARQLHTTRDTVRRWRTRFAKGGAEALRCDSPGRGRKSRVSPSELGSILHDTRGTKPSLRTLASLLGVSPSTIHRALNRSPNPLT